MRKEIPHNTRMNKEQYGSLFKRLDSLCSGETDHIALMATIVCELYQASEKFDWVGFYRNIGSNTLKIGPYQGGHGCLTIPFNRGICGKCAREMKIQNVPDVTKAREHIACSSSTMSELVIPVIARSGDLIAVLDIDSDTPSAFTDIDEEQLAGISRYFR
jgi:L-methionine (R)-S-oxide reductase